MSAPCGALLYERVLRLGLVVSSRYCHAYMPVRIYFDVQESILATKRKHVIVAPAHRFPLPPHSLPLNPAPGASPTRQQPSRVFKTTVHPSATPAMPSSCVFFLPHFSSLGDARLATTTLRASLRLVPSLGSDDHAESPPSTPSCRINPPTAPFDPLPAPYFLFFSVLEPLLTFAGAGYAIFTPLPYYIALYPPSLLAPPTAKATHVAAIMAVRQLGSCFFLFALMGCVLLPAMRRTLEDRPTELETLVQAYLACLAAADLTVRPTQSETCGGFERPSHGSLSRYIAHRFHALRPRP